ncbi:MULTISPECIES: VWA domain-containing protein [Emticicia]|uniref:vWA domain-containing protein n=1 Tax=Emticicia TaxID=312278 RepID=UPI0007D8A4CF|nr:MULTISPECIES: VWA domain-containing protein [Emticicia]
MNWIKPLTIVEFVFIGIFLLVYATYFIRLYILARRLGTTARSVIFKFITRVIYLSLCIMGLLGPSFGINEIEAQATGKDIYLVFDLSKSMDAVDIEPSRLEKTKFELIKNIDLLKSDRIGLIVFSSGAYTHSPLTFDRDAVKLFIQKLNSELFVQNGTNLNSAFELILSKFKISSVQNPRKSKVLVLITDGEDFGQLDSNILAELKKNKINLLTLGVGTAQGGQIREELDFKKDSGGKIIISKLNASYLIKLTKDLNGKYFQLNNQQNGVVDLLKEVDKVESNWIDTRKMTVANNKYYYFVFLALILIIIDILFTVRTIKI